MSTDSSPRDTAVSGVRVALGVGGVIALIVGLLILFWPGKTAMVVTAMIAVYAIVAGIIYVGMAIFAKSMGGWSRIGHVVLGILYVVAGIIMFANLGAATVWLAMFLGIVMGIMWIVEGVVSLTLPREAISKGLTVFYAIISIIAGVILLFSPLWAAVVLWWLLGLSLIALGILQVVRAFRFGREAA